MRSLVSALLAIIVLGAAAPAAPGFRPVAAMVGVEPGLWSIRALDRGEADVAPLCITDTVRLLQFRHPGARCTRLIVADTPRVATIQYSCPGAGWGRTSVRIIRSDVLRLDTQGIADNAPFALAAEARRLGDCPAEHASR